MAEYLFLLRLYANQLKRPHPSELATSFLRQRRRVYSGKTTLYTYSFCSLGLYCIFFFVHLYFLLPLVFSLAICYFVLSRSTFFSCNSKPLFSVYYVEVSFYSQSIRFLFFFHNRSIGIGRGKMQELERRTRFFYFQKTWRCQCPAQDGCGSSSHALINCYRFLVTLSLRAYDPNSHQLEGAIASSAAQNSVTQYHASCRYAYYEDNYIATLNFVLYI